MKDELQNLLNYRAGKYLDEALFEAAQYVAMDVPESFSLVPGMDEAVRLADGRVFRLDWTAREYSPQDALADLAEEARATGDEDARAVASSLRRSGYEGRLRQPRRHLFFVDQALAALDIVDWSNEAAVAVARPYLEKKQRQLQRVIHTFEEAEA